MCAVLWDPVTQYQSLMCFDYFVSVPGFNMTMNLVCCCIATRYEVPTLPLNDDFGVFVLSQCAR